MKFISGVFKFFAFLIMCLVILALPISLFARNVGEILFSRNVVSELIEDNFFDEEVLATLAEDMIGSFSLPMQAVGEVSPIPGMLTSALENLDHDQWVDIFERIIPAELTSSTFSSIFNGFYDWLDDDSDLPEIVIDLRPWKENTLENAVPVIEMILADFPECSEDQLNNIASSLLPTGGDGAGGGSIPLCSPPEPYYSQLIEKMSNSIPMMFDNFPEEVDLSDQLGSPNIDLAALKQIIKSARFLLNYAWAVILILFFIAIPMGARSFSQIFKWAGWPMIFSGGLLIGFMMVLKLSSSLLVSNLSSIFFAQIPGPAVTIIKTILISLLSIFAIPLRNQGLILLIIGGVSLIASYLVAYLTKSKKSDSQSEETSLPPGNDSMSVHSSSVEEGDPQTTDVDIEDNENDNPLSE